MVPTAALLNPFRLAAVGYRGLRHRIFIMAEATASSSSTSTVVAVCQMTSTDDVDANLVKCQKLIARSKQLGAVMTFLPECFDFVGPSATASWRLSSSIEDSAFIAAIRQTARANAIWVSLGGMHRRPSGGARAGAAGSGAAAAPVEKVFNSHVIIDDVGEIRSIYDKLHLFSVDIQGGPNLDENRFSIPGSRLVSPLAETPVGVVGLQICYDIRFPEASLSLTRAGAELLTYPSAFTRPTGEAHWESLLRARAIENQCYVVAAAQVGRHNSKRASHGHAMIVDPWGKILADCGGVADDHNNSVAIDDDDAAAAAFDEDFGVVKVAPVDLDMLRKIRREMPIWNHRREDVYGKIEARFREREITELAPPSEKKHAAIGGTTANNDAGDSAMTKKARTVDATAAYRFGADVILSPDVVFHETQLSFAFVNRKPVLPGHVLLAPKRIVTRMKEMTTEEVTDLFLLSQRVSSVVESHFGATACTFCVQDGADAGQTVAHVHAHVLPRRPGDFERNDEIYEELAKHDQGEEAGKGWRSPEEMMKEAGELRSLFRRND